MKHRFQNTEEARSYLSQRGFKVIGWNVEVPNSAVVGLKIWGVLDYLGYLLVRRED